MGHLPMAFNHKTSGLSNLKPLLLGSGKVATTCYMYCTVVFCYRARFELLNKFSYPTSEAMMRQMFV